MSLSLSATNMDGIFVNDDTGLLLKNKGNRYYAIGIIKDGVATNLTSRDIALAKIFGIPVDLDFMAGVKG